jgi:paraquat-inducible protein B
LSTASTPPQTAKPKIQRSTRWNRVWVVPIVALLLGAWLVYKNFASHGEMARVRFQTADGLAAGKTEVRCRSVRVGLVKKIQLAEDLQSVLVFIEFDPNESRLLRRGSRFWVVRPRLSPTEISGVGTLITGAYIEMDPGPENAERHTLFRGRETPPATSRNVDGLRLQLTSREAGSIIINSPVFYRGFEVGRIEDRKLSEDGNEVRFSAFIEQDYAKLVTENTRFWNVSGLQVSAGAGGIKLRTPSVQAIVSGGVSFGTPPPLKPSTPVANGTSFHLFDDEEAAEQSTFNPSFRFLLLFDQSVRGLDVGAPVEFRGLTVGRVSEVSINLIAESEDPRIPVMIEIDPSMMRSSIAQELGKPDSEFLQNAAKRGLRAALKTANLITGSMYVDLDYYPNLPQADVGTFAEFTTLPTTTAGLVHLEGKLTALLDKLQAVPLDTIVADLSAAAAEAKTTLASSRGALAEIEDAAASARRALDNPELNQLPADLRTTLDELRKSLTSVGPEGPVQGDLLRTLEELRASLRSLKGLTTTIDEKPNSLLFGRDSSGNPTPKAPRSSR